MASRAQSVLALFALFIFPCVLAYSDPTVCTGSSQFYDIIGLQCSACPNNNTIRANDFTFCNCSTSYYANPAVIGFNYGQSCIALTSPTSYTPATQIVSRYNLDGSANVAVVTCSNGYPDSTNTHCIPCGSGQTYSTTLSSCVCTPGYQFGGQCYTNTNASWSPINSPTTNPANYLVEVNGIVGCGQYGLIQSCNQLVNKCVQNGYSAADFFCSMLATLQKSKSPATGLPTYTFSGQITTSLSIYASSIVGTNTSDVKNTLQFYLAQYNADGSLNDFKSMDNSIFSCYFNNEDIVKFMSFGLNFYKQCASPRTFATTYFYDVYVVDLNGNLNEVPILISGTYYKRFTPTAYNSIELDYMSAPPLQTPYLTLTKQSPAIISNNSNASSTSLNYLPFLAIFAVFIFITFIIDFYRYMRYNPDQNNDPYYCCKAVFLFLVHIVKFVAVGIWLWVLCLSGYCFCFYKFQQTIYIILPSPSNDSSGLYATFGAFFYITFSFTILAIFIMMFNLVNSTDYFLIDWEKEKELSKFQVGRNRKEVSVWRKVLLVNELYEMSMSRIINIELVSLLSILFLSGLNWINLNSMVPNTLSLVTDNTVTTSPILSYFIITIVIFVIALLQFLIRHAFKTWYPLPIEDFIDLCSVSNISIIIFDEALHGYYIHGMNPMGQSQGSLMYIESMFEKQAKSFGKSRSFKLQDPDSCQSFEVIFPFEIRQAFQIKYKSRFNQKLAGKSYNTSILTNPIPEMLNQQDYKDLEEINNTMLQTFKYYLEGVKTSAMNIRERNLFEKIINCPINTQMMGKLPVFFKDMWYEFSNVMLSGHEFILLFNFINFVNIFYIATSNVYIAFFIAFIFQKIFTFSYSFFIKRNISKNTLIDDKFFS